MEKRRISGHEVVQDVNSGMDDLALMGKYKLTRKELDLLLKKLVAAQRLSETELSELQLLWAQKKGTAWRCPACHMPQAHEFDECPQCGIIVAKFKGKFRQEQGSPATEDRQEQEFIEVPPVEPDPTTAPPDRPSAIPGGPDATPKCPNCSTSLPQDAKFCTSCGAKVSAL